MKSDTTINEATGELRDILEELYFTIEEANAFTADCLDHVRERYLTAIRRVREVERLHDRHLADEAE